MPCDKQTIYASLVDARKQCTQCQGLVNPSRCAGGAFDSNEIGPWTRWQGNLDAELMIVGQDWGDAASFESGKGLDEATNPTNHRLWQLLAEAGYPVAEYGQQEGRGTIFFTNAILCLKSGGLSGPVKSAWFAECGPRFLRPQIEIVRPRVVITLGEKAYQGISIAFKHRPDSFRTAVESVNKLELLPSVHLFPVYHCSPRVLAGTRIWDQQLEDWRRIGDVLRNPKPEQP
jgi:uracil-DNA glycosylase